jgi:exonuclease III
MTSMVRFDGQRFGKLKVATWNVKRIAEKMEELQTELLKGKIDIAIITETKKKKKDQKTGNYAIIYCGVPANQWASSGVAIAIRKGWKQKIQDYTWISDRVIETRIQVMNRNFTIVGVYGLVEGKEQDTEEFYRELQQIMDKIHKKEILF